MNDFILVLKALADESRFRIIYLLLTHDLCVGALADHLSMSKAAVSQHLQILRKAGLVKGEKRGYWTHYGVDRDVLRRIAETLREMADQSPDGSIACHRSIQDNIRRDVAERTEFVMYPDGCRQQARLSDKL
jgi:ArsR family transcriptional regulator, arsenate/arsenite/antimonite-responsive transcriptional repressor